MQKEYEKLSFGSAETGRKDVFLNEEDSCHETYGNVTKKRSQTHLVPRSHTDLDDTTTYEKIIPVSAEASQEGTNIMYQNSRSPSSGFGDWQTKEEPSGLGFSIPIEA